MHAGALWQVLEVRDVDVKGSSVLMVRDATLLHSHAASPRQDEPSLCTQDEKCRAVALDRSAVCVCVKAHRQVRCVTVAKKPCRFAPNGGQRIVASGHIVRRVLAAHWQVRCFTVNKKPILRDGQYVPDRHDGWLPIEVARGSERIRRPPQAGAAASCNESCACC